LTAATDSNATVGGWREHPAAGLSQGLRIAAVATLVLGAGLQAASWLVHAEPDLEVSYSRFVTNPGAPELSLVLNLLATPFLIASVAVYVLLGRVRSPRLAWTGGALLVTGLVALGYLLGTEVFASALARAGQLRPVELAASMTGLDSPSAGVMSLMFVLGVGLGIPLTAVSLWRSLAVPRAAAALLVLFLVIDLVGQGTSRPVLGIVARVIALVAAFWIGFAVSRAEPIPER
jgi:hypothetical protein